ncbi:MAG: hypothetical protein H7841_16520 [Magnetospirillum sp. WYHS-4]
MLPGRDAALFQILGQLVIAEFGKRLPLTIGEVEICSCEAVSLAVSLDDAMFSENTAGHLAGDNLVVFDLALILAQKGFGDGVARGFPAVQ